MGDIWQGKFSFLEEMKSDLSAFGAFWKLLKGDLSAIDLSAHRLRHLDLLGYSLDGH